MKKIKLMLIVFICFIIFTGFSVPENSKNGYAFDYYDIKNQLIGASSYPSLYNGSLELVSLNTANENQGALKTCWAFASNNVLEAYLEKNNMTYNGNRYNFSENSPDYVARYLGDTYSFGDPNTVYNTLKQWIYGFSPVEESSFGSFFTTQQNKSLNSYLNIKNTKIDVRNARLFNSLSISTLLDGSRSDAAVQSYMSQYTEKIKKYIYEYGGAFAVIHSKFLNTDARWCYNPGTENINTYSNTAHAITLIGWDDNYEPENNKAPYKGAWIAANSWGGNAPQFYISYYDASVYQSVFGVSRISINESDWNNNYIVGISNKADHDINSVGEYFEKFSSTNTSVTYRYYIGEEEEYLDSIKLLYVGFDGINSLPTSNNITFNVSSNGKTSTAIMTPYPSEGSSNTVQPGINTGTFTSAIKVSGNVDITMNTSLTGDYTVDKMVYMIALRTKNSSTSKTVYINGDSSNVYSNRLTNVLRFNIVTKNIDSQASSNITVKVYDVNNNDITSSFTVSKHDLIDQTSYFTLNQKSDLLTNKIKVSVSVGGASNNKTFNISASSGYSFNGLTVDETNKIIKVSPNTTVSSLLSKVTGNTKKVLNSSGATLTEGAKLSTGSKLLINGNIQYEIAVYGDVNGDGNVSISDVMKIASHSLKSGELTTKLLLTAGDVNFDGTISISDVMKVATHSIKGVGL